jgi:hypothetical protein
VVSDYAIAIGQAKFLFLILGLSAVQDDPEQPALGQGFFPFSG